MEIKSIINSNINMAFTWNDILAFSTVFTTVLQFLTGAIVCRKYILKKSTGDSSALPFICGFLSCSLWLKYGFIAGDNAVILVNSIGATLFFMYTLVYWMFTINKKILVRQFMGACLIILLTVFYTYYERDDHEKIVRTMGLICCTVTVLFFAAPLSMLIHVVKYKNSESLPFPLIISCFFVSLQWFLYGVLINDIYIKITNILGCLLSGSQLLLFMLYPSKSVSSGGPAYKPLEQTIY